jgi:hypothetical protein
MQKITIKSMLLVIAVLFIQSCSITSSLSTLGPESAGFRPNHNETEFIETRTTGALNLTLSEILAVEKAKYGANISLVNIIEQTKLTTVLFVFTKQEKYYIYDVVRNKSTK